MKRLSLGTQLYISILSLFLIFAIGSILVQQYSERQHHRAMIDERLQAYNNQLIEAIRNKDGLTEESLEAHIGSHVLDELRLTVIDLKGNVIFDNISKDYASMSNHLDREEVRMALEKGRGRVIDRASATTNSEYFYSATYSPEDEVIVRSALPYDANLSIQLSTSTFYVWFVAVMMILLLLVLKSFVNRVVSRIEHRKMLENQQVRRELTQNIAHELKTPITSVKAYLETLISEDDLPVALQKDFLRKSLSQTQLLASLVRDISVINRLEYRPDFYEREEAELGEIVASVLDDVALHLEQHNMTCHCDIPEAEIIGNKQLLYGIFRNMLDNAILYAGDGKNIDIKVVDAGDMYRCTFADNGKGVPEETLPHLFDRFFRIDKGRERAMGSTGLGLSIVKNAINFHGGEIEARNLPEGGLCFEFTLKKK